MAGNSNSRNSSSFIFGSIAAIALVGLSAFAALKLKSQNKNSPRTSNQNESKSENSKPKRLNSDFDTASMSVTIIEPSPILNGIQPSNEQISLAKSMQLNTNSTNSSASQTIFQNQNEQLRVNSFKTIDSISASADLTMDTGNTAETFISQCTPAKSTKNITENSVETCGSFTIGNSSENSSQTCKAPWNQMPKGIHNEEKNLLEPVPKIISTKTDENPETEQKPLIIGKSLTKNNVPFETEIMCHSSVAAGKVLISGGYLILDRTSSGIVLNVSSSIRTHVCSLTPEIIERFAINSVKDSDDELQIYVYAPQRHEQLLHYTYDSSLMAQFDESDLRLSNPFLRNTLQLTLQFVYAATNKRSNESILVNVEGDEAFYTADGKTGLGSSAAFTSSLVCALLAHFGLLSRHECEISLSIPTLSTLLHIQNEMMLSLAHNLAQLCHCLSQGKIGSGFDISAAFYGSQMYTRFSASVFDEILKNHITDEMLLRTILPNVEEFAPSLQSTPRHSRRSSKRTLQEALEIKSPSSSFNSLNLPTELVDLLSTRKNWDQIIGTFSMPKKFRVLLGAAGAGSSTSDLVKKVNAWRAHSSAWDKLVKANARFQDLFKRICLFAREAVFEPTIEVLCSLPCEQWSWISSLEAVDAQLVAIVLELRITHAQIRSLLRTIGSEAGVEIEPLKQTELCDETLKIQGVLLSGCPGAGGEDAVFAIVMNVEAVEKVKQMWSDKGVQCLPVEVCDKPIEISNAKRDVSQLSIYK